MEERKQADNNEAAPKPDHATLHKTDPQENMDGPVSSTLKKTGDAFDTDETQEEADEKKERDM